MAQDDRQNKPPTGDITSPRHFPSLQGNADKPGKDSETRISADRRDILCSESPASSPSSER